MYTSTPAPGSSRGRCALGSKGGGKEIAVVGFESLRDTDIKSRMGNKIRTNERIQQPS